MNQIISVTIISIIFTLNGIAGVLSVPDIFSDNMVLQANESFVLSGNADPETDVRVEIKNRIQKTTANENGRWQVWFSKFNEGPVGTILIKSRIEVIEIKNVLAAELWLCSGQSNMAWPANRSDVTIDSMREEIRFFKATDRNGSPNEITDQIKGAWEICSIGNYEECSAVGLSFAIHLSNAIHKPVGLVISAVGGTPIESWTQLEMLKGKEYNEQAIGIREEWDKTREEDQIQYDLKMKEWKTANDIAKEEGGKLPKRPRRPSSTRQNWNLASLYNSLIHPLSGINFKGVLWYQGEANADNSFAYRYKLMDMIQNWRASFGNKNLPFYIVQLPEFKTSKDWVTLRESQAFASNSPNVNLVVTLGLGDPTNIHPVKKTEVGRRIALQALKNDYNFEIVALGPIYKKKEVKSNKLKLYFSGNGLKSADGEAIRNFEISGDGQNFFPAQVAIEGNSLLVWNEKVSNPSHARYAWKNVPEQVNLVNSSNLPAAPFSTTPGH